MILEVKLPFRPVVRNVQNNDAYFYNGNNQFENIRSGGSGMVDDDTAGRVFKINVAATEIINEYPIIAEMIQKLNLKFNNNKK
jgi:hypothetical protein